MMEKPLPINSVIPEIRKLLSNNRNLVLTASPGAGKTTIVPLALLNEKWLGGKKILMLQPRRIAARMAAARMANLHGSQVGETIGYQVRFEKKTGHATRLEILTEGLLTRRIQRDPFLEGVGLLIFDEFHERSLHADLGLALAREIQKSVREDLKIMVMSATLETGPISGFLGNAPVVSSPGFLHPVECRHIGQPLGEQISRQVSRTVISTLSDPGIKGDILVFLPGEGEINQVMDILQGDPSSVGVLIQPLHGSLPLDRQDAVLRPQKSRRVILATNIAETSLTIEGITTVIDSGYRRRMRIDPATGLERLELERISQDSADQRAGRAGRLGPGKVFRLWSQMEHSVLQRFTQPEVAYADLSQLVLELALWGKHDPASFEWLEPPPSTSLKSARDLLYLLGGIEKGGSITAMGKRMAELPVHPRISRFLLQAKSYNISGPACDLASIISEKDFIIRNRTQAGNSMVGTCDYSNHLDLLERTRSGLRENPEQGNIDFRAVRRTEKVADQLSDILKMSNITDVKFVQGCNPREDLLLMAILTGFPDRVARRRPANTGRNQPGFLLVGGKGLTLDPSSIVRDSDLILAISIDGVEREGTGTGVIRKASKVEPKWLEELFPHLILEKRELFFDAARKAVCARKQTTYIDLILRNQPAELTSSEQIPCEEILVQEAKKDLRQSLEFSPESDQFLFRSAIVSRNFPGSGLPHFDELFLIGALPELVRGAKSFNDLKNVNLRKFMENHLSFQQIKQFNQLAPERIEVPSGSQIRLKYSADGPPVLAVKLQELFGWTQTPTIVSGRVAVLIHLLSPAGRPLQITRDLKNFWSTVYPALRKEMRGQYPRHPWPEDPFTAPPQRGVRKRNP